VTVGVIGAGGVGGYLAGALMRGGAEVLLAVRGAHGRSIAQEGLRIKSREGSQTLHPAQTAPSPDHFVKRPEALLFCVKGYDLQTAAQSAAPVIDKKTLLVPLGNGVGNGAVLRALYPDNPVAEGVVYIVSHIEAPGVVALKGPGAKVVMGVDGALPAALCALGRHLEQGGVKVKLSEEITTEVWRKFLFISAMATLTSRYDKPMGAVAAEHGDALAAVLEEILAVGRAEGARLDHTDIERVYRQLEKVPYDSPTSMWLDFQAGRPTELEALTGKAVHLAQKHGINAPVLRESYEILRRKRR